MISVYRSFPMALWRYNREFLNRRMTAPPTVLYLIDKLHRAGAQTNLSHLARGLLAAGRFRPFVVCLTSGGPLADELLGAGVDLRVLGIRRIYGGSALRALGRLARWMREEKVEIVHTYLVSANLFGAFASALAGNTRLVTTRRDLGFSRNLRLSLLEQIFVNPRASRVVTPSEAVSESARRERGLEARKITTIANGVDCDFFRPDARLRTASRAALGIASEAPVAGVVANFLPVKGHEDFLHAAARVGGPLPDARFVLVGDGALRQDMEKLARDLGIGERVLFTGARTDTRELFSALDLVVSPSHSEGMSNVILEAMSMARPILATSVGGTRELLRHQVTGVLVPPHDPAALAEAMLSLFSDRGRAKALGARAREEAESRFGLKEMVHRYTNLYDELLGSGPARTSS